MTYKCNNCKYAHQRTNTEVKMMLRVLKDANITVNKCEGLYVQCTAKKCIYEKPQKTTTQTKQLCPECEHGHWINDEKFNKNNPGMFIKTDIGGVWCCNLKKLCIIDGVCQQFQRKNTENQ